MNYTYALIQFMHWPIFRDHIFYWKTFWTDQTGKSANEPEFDLYN